MKRPSFLSSIFKSTLVLLVFFVSSSCLVAQTGPFPNPPTAKNEGSGLQTAVFAGGCFWGVEGVFESLKGVTQAVSGYCGGNVANPTYEMVSSGTTGHAESVRVTYDPAVIGYGTLLKVFFSIAHDPTELNYQGPDEGTNYRSAIFYANSLQKDLAEEYVKELTADRVFSSPIVTQIVPLQTFYPAEAYHQHFLRNNPTYPYIVYWDLPKLRALERTYPDLVAAHS